MGFKIIPKPARNYGGEPTPAFKAYPLGDNLVGEVFIPGSIVEELGWKEGMHFDVARGEGEDEGWFALIPKEGKAKAKLRKNGAGGYSFRERTLAFNLEAPVKRADIMAKADDGQFVFRLPDVT